MTLFASPDFGASGVVFLFVLMAWAIVLLATAVGIACGAKLFRNASPKVRKCGVLLVLASGLVPLCCCLGPPQAIRVIYGNYPLGSYPNNKIKVGMSPDEVTAILGTPHERGERADGQQWFYWLDSYGMGWFCVSFDADSRVIGAGGN